MLNIITVEGPSNTGKSTLLDQLEKTLKVKELMSIVCLLVEKTMVW